MGKVERKARKAERRTFLGEVSRVVPVAVEPRLRKYSPDQDRDESGRFGAGGGEGGGGSLRTQAGHVVSNPTATDRLIARQEHKPGSLLAPGERVVGAQFSNGIYTTVRDHPDLRAAGVTGRH